MKAIFTAAALAVLPLAALAAATPFTAVELTGSETAPRHLTGRELAATLQKGMTPGAFYSQVLLSKNANYQVINTIRDKNGQAEIHAGWGDHLFVQSGEATLVTGGAVPDAKLVAPGEQRGSAIKGGNSVPMRPGDYFFVPAGTPHQMIVAPGKRIQFIAFKTHK